MTYIPQFINGDAGHVGSMFVRGSHTESDARNIIGLGELDRPVFAGATIGNDYAPNLLVRGNLTVEVQSAEGLHVTCTTNTGWRQPIVSLFKRGVDGRPLYANEANGAVQLGGFTSLRSFTTENWVSTGRGSRISLSSTANGTAAEAERVRVDQDGRVIIGSPFTNDGVNQLQVNGTIRTAGIASAGGTLAIRSGTDPQSLLLHRTYTSPTNYEGLRIDTTADAYQIGSAVGSAGGENRVLELGRWETAGTFTKWMSVGPSDIRFNFGTEEIASWVRLSGSRKVFSLNALKAIEVLSPGIMEVGNITTPLYLLSNAGLFTPSLPTTDPASAGQVWNNGGLLSLGEFDGSAARTSLGLGEGDSPSFDMANFARDVRIGAVDSHIYSGSNGRKLIIQAPGGTPVRAAMLQLVGGPSTIANQTIGAVEFHNPNFSDTNGRTRIAEIFSASSGGNLGSDLRFRTTQHLDTLVRERMRILGTGKVIIGSPYADDGTEDRLQVNGTLRATGLYGTGGTLSIRNGTDPQSLLLHRTYTSDTSYEGLRVDATGDNYCIGSAAGIAGGSNRSIAIGAWAADGTFTERMRISTNAVSITAVTSTGTGGTFKWSRATSNYDSGHYAEMGQYLGSQGLRMAVFRSGVPVSQIQVIGVLDSASTGHYVGIYGAGEVETARFTANNRLGIGTSTPDTTFHVVGGVTLSSLPTIDPATADQVWNNGGLLALGNFVGESARTSLGLGGSDSPQFAGVLAIGRIFTTVGIRISDSDGQQQAVSIERDGITINSASAFRWGDRYAGGGWHGPPSLELWRDNSDILAQRRGTNAQIFRLYKTYTSTTNFERLQFDTTTDAYRIGSAVGSTGGTQRVLEWGRWLGDGSYQTVMQLSTSNDLELFDISNGNLKARLSSTELNFARAANGGYGNLGVFVTDDQITLRGRLRTYINVNGSNGITVEGSKVRIGHNTGVIAGSEAVRIEGTTRLTSPEITFQSLPTSDPAAAGRIWNNGGLVTFGNFDLEAAQDALDVSFLNVTEMETTDDYVYYGGTRSGGSWKINRYDKDTLEMTSATANNNSGVSDLEDAWIDKGSLVYE